MRSSRVVWAGDCPNATGLLLSRFCDNAVRNGKANSAGQFWPFALDSTASSHAIQGRNREPKGCADKTRNGLILTSGEFQQNVNNRKCGGAFLDGRGNLISPQHEFPEVRKNTIKILKANSNPIVWPPKRRGGRARLKALDSKSSVRGTVPGVRIPPSPPTNFSLPAKSYPTPLVSNQKPVRV